MTKANCDEFEAFKPQTHHGLLLSYGVKVPVRADSMKFLAARYLKTKCLFTLVDKLASNNNGYLYS